MRSSRILGFGLVFAALAFAPPAQAEHENPPPKNIERNVRPPETVATFTLGVAAPASEFSASALGWAPAIPRAHTVDLRPQQLWPRSCETSGQFSSLPAVLHDVPCTAAPIEHDPLARARWAAVPIRTRPARSRSSKPAKPLLDITGMLMGMTALVGNRDTRELADNKLFRYPVAEGVKIFKGAQMALNADGYAQPATEDDELTAIGRSEQNVDNTDGNDGDEFVDVKRGCFPWVNEANGITIAHVGKQAYMVDDQTVAEDDGEGARSVAGIIRQIDAQGVWVETP